MSVVRKIGGLIPRVLLLHIKYVKQYIHRIIKRKGLFISQYKNISIAKENTHVFFGYYDVTPFNLSTDEIVYLNFKNDENRVSIVLSHLNNIYDERIIGCSFAWNWQQGVRLRWMPNNSREICFNDFCNNDYLARIVNVDTKEERTICKPLYDISPDGKIGLSIDFERLGAKRPGYGYTCRKYTEADINLAKEGIDIVDIYNNTYRRILDYTTISKVAGTRGDGFSNNYINHIAFSPNGDKFLFFWLTVEEMYHRADLLVYDLTKGTLTVLENKDRASHYVWLDDDRILCTAYNDKSACYYYIYNTVDRSKKIVNPEVLHEDGHPCMLDDSTILTDTYPDLNGYQRIYLANIKQDGYKPLVEIYSNCIIEGEKRTDLHPRLKADKRIISFDSNQHNYRSLNFMFIES